MRVHNSTQPALSLRKAGFLSCSHPACWKPSMTPNCCLSWGTSSATMFMVIIRFRSAMYSGGDNRHQPIWRLIYLPGPATPRSPLTGPAPFVRKTLKVLRGHCLSWHLALPTSGSCGLNSMSFSPRSMTCWHLMTNPAKERPNRTGSQRTRSVPYESRH